MNMNKELDEHCERARLVGARKNLTPNQFKRQLIQIGLEKYEKVILPLEIGETYSPHVSGARIIEFPSKRAGNAWN